MNLVSIFQDCACCGSILILAGLITIISITFKLCFFLYRKFLRPPKNLFLTYGQKDSWALVTGASDGIGKVFCDSLAKRGFNVCLIARNPEKLELARKELQAANPKIQTAVVIADFAASAQDPNQFYNKISDDLVKQNISDIAILINNAGYSDMGRFEKMAVKEMTDMIGVNIYPAVFLTKIVIGKNLNRGKKSLIINLASVTGVVPLPFLEVYGATKAFNENIARSLALEYAGKIDVMALKPNYVSTKMTKLKAGGAVITGRDCVEGCLRDAGWDSVTAGNWRHEVLEWLMRNVIPTSTMVNRSKAAAKRIEERMAKKA